MQPRRVVDQYFAQQLRIAIDGVAAVEPVREFLRREEDGVSWGLRVLADVLSSAKVNELVVGELARLGGEYSRDPDKKLVLLTWLVEHRGETAAAGVQEALLPLLEDFSDDVRIGALRALATLSSGEPVREGLLQLLLRLDEEEDRRRVVDEYERYFLEVLGR